MGEFSFEVSTSRREQLVASAPGYRSRHLELPLEQRDALEIILEAGGPEVSGTVIDAAGGVVPGAFVSARVGLDRTLVASCVSNSEGQFRLIAPEGVTEIEANAIAYSHATRRIYAPAQGVHLVVAQQSIIAGRVLERETRSSVADVKVEAIAREGARRSAQNVTTDSDGRFELLGLASGVYEIVASAPTWRGEGEVIQVGVGETFDDLDVLVARATTLMASVQLDDDPCSAGSVEVSGQVRQVEPLLTDGTAQLEGLLPGTYLVSYSCAASAAGPLREIVGAEESIAISDRPVSRTWKLAQPSETEERQADGSGNVRIAISAGDSAAPFGAVLVSQQTGEPVRGSRSAGTVTFEALSLGEYTAYLEQAPSVQAKIRLEKDGQTVEAVLEAPRESMIAGRVIDEDGQPAADVWVRAYNTDFPFAELAPAGIPTLTDADGAFQIHGLFAQAYDLGAEGPGRAVVERVAGGTRDVSLQLRIDDW